MGIKDPNPRKRKKQWLKMGHGGTLDSNASGLLGDDTDNDVDITIYMHRMMWILDWICDPCRIKFAITFKTMVVVL